MPIRLAVNGRSLLGPRAGIGQYTHHLLSEIAGNGAFEPWVFDGMAWTRFRPVPSGDVGPRHRGPHQLRRLVPALVPRARSLAKTLQQPFFSRGVRRIEAALYHEPGFLPFRFHGATVSTIHDLSHLRYPETHPAGRVRQLTDHLPGAIEQSDVVLTVSRFVANEVIKTFPVDPSKVVPVHNGVSDQFRPRPSQAVQRCLAQYRLRYGHYILAVGTLEPRKNLVSLIRAFRQLSALTRRERPLVIVGMKGWQYDVLDNELQSLLAAGDVQLPGYVGDHELPQLYAGASMLVYPSIYEGFGLPPLEAMASGVPVIASNRASLPEVVGDAGMLVEPYDIDAIAAAMQQVVDDTAKRDVLRRAGLERARQFSWTRCARETMAVYRQLLEI